MPQAFGHGKIHCIPALDSEDRCSGHFCSFSWASFIRWEACCGYAWVTDRSNNIPTINHPKFTEICQWGDIILKGRMYSIQCSSGMAILWPILWSWKQWPFPTTATAATIEACSSYWNPFGIPYTFPFRCLLEIVPQNIHATTIGSLSTGRVEKNCQAAALRIILSITRKD